ncbi:ERC protein 2-like isoform X2 [Synchiropus splendidus]|uniref:ERC protein 2-like isoform X2 n=1 Tax=Synchiropus splendidus TaxID=270530 RepID=UPI00237DBE39|nr:ERC protein 2-like isoform X2 [Synchiropus splendidus]
MSSKYQTSPHGTKILSPSDEDGDIRAENVYLKTLLLDLSHQHTRQSKLMEKLLYFGPVSSQNPQLLSDEDATKTQPQKKDEGQMNGRASGQDTPNNTTPNEESTDLHVNTSAQCEEEKVKEKDLKESNHRGKYDQEREAYSREMMGRMLWLERQLIEARRAVTEEDEDKVFQMKEYYENLLEKSKNALDELRLRLDVTQNDFMVSQKWCLKTEAEVQKLKQELRTQKIFYETEAQDLQDKTEELMAELEEERARSANWEQQAIETQKQIADLHFTNLKKTDELERQIAILSRELEDEHEDCSSLKSKMVKIVKVLKGQDGHKSTF